MRLFWISEFTRQSKLVVFIYPESAEGKFNYQTSSLCIHMDLLATALHPHLCNTSQRKSHLQRCSKVRNKQKSWGQAIPTRLPILVFPRVTVNLLSLHSHPERTIAETRTDWTLRSWRLEAEKWRSLKWGQEQQTELHWQVNFKHTVISCEEKCHQDYIYYYSSHVENISCVHVGPKHQNINNICVFSASIFKTPVLYSTAVCFRQEVS